MSVVKLLSCSKSILIQQLDQDQYSIKLQPFNGTINSAVYSSNNHVIASCGNIGKIALHNSENGKQLLMLEDQNDIMTPINQIKFTYNSQYLAAGCNDGKVKVFNLRQKKLYQVYSEHWGPVSSVDWSLDNSLLVSASQDGEVIVRNIEQSNNSMWNFSTPHSQGIKMVKFSYLNKNLLAQAQYDGGVTVLDLEKRMAQFEYKNLHNSIVSALCQSKVNPILMCVASQDKNISFLDIKDNKVVQKMECPEPLTSLSLNSDGHTLACGTLYGNIYIYDLRNRQNYIKQFLGHDDECVNYLEFSYPSQDKSPLKPSSKLEQQVQSQQNQIPQQQSNNINQQQQQSQNVGQIMQNSGRDKSPLHQQLQQQQKNISSIGQISQFQQNNVHTSTPYQKKFSNTGGISPIPQVSNISSNFSSSIKGLQQDQDDPQVFDQIQFSKNNNIQQNDSLQQGTLKIQQQQQFKQPQIPPNIHVNKEQNQTNSLSSINNKKFEIKISSTNTDNDIQTKKPITLDTIAKNINQNKPTNIQIEQKINDNKSEEKIQVEQSINLQENSNVKSHINDQTIEIKSFIEDQISNLHLDIIKQFQIQQQDMEQLLIKSLIKQQQLEQRVKELEEENSKLKKISY